MANHTGKGCFKKGESGNPGGRPKLPAEVKEAFQGLFLKTGVRTRAQLVRLAIERYWGEVLRPQDPGGDKPE